MIKNSALNQGLRNIRKARILNTHQKNITWKLFSKKLFVLISAISHKLVSLHSC